MSKKLLKVYALISLTALLTLPASRAGAEDSYAPSSKGDREADSVFARIGVGFSVGGGIENFSAGAIDDAADVGGAWTARLSIGTRSMIAVEAAYIGTANGLSALGLDDRAVLLGNGIEGDLRINLTTGSLQPYIFGGAAWKHYDVVNEHYNTSSIRDSDEVIELPVGAGIAYRFRGFMVDLRGDFRPTFSNDLVTGPVSGDGGGDGNLNNWTATARFGFEL